MRPFFARARSRAFFAEVEEQGSMRVFFLQRKTEQSELCSDVARPEGFSPRLLHRFARSPARSNPCETAPNKITHAFHG